MRNSAAVALLTAALPASGLAATGGPDAFGYTFSDSTEPDGPAFEAVETSGQVNVPTGGGFTVPLPFSFPFYGAEYGQVLIGDDGVLSFTGPYPGSLPECLPHLTGAGLLPFWDLLDSASGLVKTRNMAQEDPAYFVVHYDEVVHSLTTSLVDLQVRLYETGVVEFHYDSVGEAGGGLTSTVGIDAGDGVALQYACSSDALTDGSAVRFIPPAEAGDDDDSATDDDDSATDDDDDSVGDDDDGDPDDDDSAADDPIEAPGCQSECRGLGVRFGALPVLLLGLGRARRRPDTRDG